MPEPDVIEQRRAARLARINPATHVKAAWGFDGSDMLYVGVYNPEQPLDDSAVAVRVIGSLPSKKHPERLNIKGVITGTQLTDWGQRLSDVLASCEHATNEQWLTLTRHVPHALRKDKPPKVPTRTKRAQPDMTRLI